MRIAKATQWTYAGIDPTPAPLGDVSIGRAIENFIGAPFGSGGTMTAAGIITRAVQSTPVKQVGYSGLMVPVLEDNVLAKRWEEGTYNMDSLLAYSAVCAGGLDTDPAARRYQRRAPRAHHGRRGVAGLQVAQAAGRAPAARARQRPATARNSATLAWPTPSSTESRRGLR